MGNLHSSRLNSSNDSSGSFGSVNGKHKKETMLFSSAETLTDKPVITILEQNNFQIEGYIDEEETDSENSSDDENHKSIVKTNALVKFPYPSLLISLLKEKIVPTPFNKRQIAKIRQYFEDHIDLEEHASMSKSQFEFLLLNNDEDSNNSKRKLGTVVNFKRTNSFTNSSISSTNSTNSSQASQTSQNYSTPKTARQITDLKLKCMIDLLYQVFLNESKRFLGISQFLKGISMWQRGVNELEFLSKNRMLPFSADTQQYYLLINLCVRKHEQGCASKQRRKTIPQARRNLSEGIQFRDFNYFLTAICTMDDHLQKRYRKVNKLLACLYVHRMFKHIQAQRKTTQAKRDKNYFVTYTEFKAWLSYIGSRNGVAPTAYGDEQHLLDQFLSRVESKEQGLPVLDLINMFGQEKDRSVQGICIASNRNEGQHHGIATPIQRKQRVADMPSFSKGDNSIVRKPRVENRILCQSPKVLKDKKKLNPPHSYSKNKEKAKIWYDFIIQKHKRMEIEDVLQFVEDIREFTLGPLANQTEFVQAVYSTTSNAIRILRATMKKLFRAANSTKGDSTTKKVKAQQVERKRQNLTEKRARSLTMGSSKFVNSTYRQSSFQQRSESFRSTKLRLRKTSSEEGRYVRPSISNRLSAKLNALTYGSQKDPPIQKERKNSFVAIKSPKFHSGSEFSFSSKLLKKTDILDALERKLDDNREEKIVKSKSFKFSASRRASSRIGSRHGSKIDSQRNPQLVLKLVEADKVHLPYSKSEIAKLSNFFVSIANEKEVLVKHRFIRLLGFGVEIAWQNNKKKTRRFSVSPYGAERIDCDILSRLFHVFNTANDGEIDLVQFIVGLSNYLENDNKTVSDEKQNKLFSLTKFLKLFATKEDTIDINALSRMLSFARESEIISNRDTLDGKTPEKELYSHQLNVLFTEKVFSDILGTQQNRRISYNEFREWIMDNLSMRRFHQFLKNEPIVFRDFHAFLSMRNNTNDDFVYRTFSWTDFQQMLDQESSDMLLDKDSFATMLEYTHFNSSSRGAKMNLISSLDQCNELAKNLILEVQTNVGECDINALATWMIENNNVDSTIQSAIVLALRVSHNCSMLLSFAMNENAE